MLVRGKREVPVTLGIHHITALVNDVQETVDFYAGVLGLRLVKRTVHYDAPDVYHLFFGNEDGSPGTIISFLPQEQVTQGMLGGGQVGMTVFAVPVGSLLFWRKRLASFEIKVMENTRFGEQYITFTDNSGLIIEIVERDQGPVSWWSTSAIPQEHAIKGLGGVMLFSKNSEATSEVLTSILGLKLIGEEDGVLRFYAEGELGNVIDLNVENMPAGKFGAGVIHHLAWRAINQYEQEDFCAMIEHNHLQYTGIEDQIYFKAMYFREPGGLLFQIASEQPGFTCDQEVGDLGKKLMLPEELELKRASIVRRLHPFVLREL